MMSVSTDAAPKAVPNIFAVHLLLHHLAKKTFGDYLLRSLQYVIKAIKDIKSHSINDRLFTQFCIENKDFNRLLLYTGVRWLWI